MNETLEQTQLIERITDSILTAPNGESLVRCTMYINRQQDNGMLTDYQASALKQAVAERFNTNF